MTTLNPRDGVAPTATPRGQAKAQRRACILAASVKLFAEHGFHHVSNEDIGAAAGVSGPAVYRHFESKQAILAASLVEASRELLAGGQGVDSQPIGAEARLKALVSFHVQFALRDPAMIVIQDREMANLADPDRRTVRKLQRNYVSLWVKTLHEIAPGRLIAELTLRAHAVFGLINSTPHALKAGRLGGAGNASADHARTALTEMAWAALASSWTPLRN